MVANSESCICSPEIWCGEGRGKFPELGYERSQAEALPAEPGLPKCWWWVSCSHVAAWRWCCWWQGTFPSPWLPACAHPPGLPAPWPLFGDGPQECQLVLIVSSSVCHVATCRPGAGLGPQQTLTSSCQPPASFMLPCPGWDLSVPPGGGTQPCFPGGTCVTLSCLSCNLYFKGI